MNNLTTQRWRVSFHDFELVKNRSFFFEGYVPAPRHSCQRSEAAFDTLRKSADVAKKRPICSRSSRFACHNVKSSGN